MLISIIVPLYNSGPFILNFINGIANQIFSDYEIVFIDGNSSDESFSLVKKNETIFKNIKVVSEADKGIFDAMNKGVRLAKGEWLYFMGADDMFFDNQVLLEISKYLNYDHDIVYGDSLWVPDRVKEEGEWTLEKILFQSINHQRIFYRRSLFNDEVKYNIKYKIAADHALNIKLFCDAQIRKSYVPIMIAKYHSGGFSSNKFDVHFWEDWDSTFYANFKNQLPKKIIYSSLGIYSRYLIDKREYLKTTKVLFKVIKNTLNFGLVLLMTKYWFSKIFTNG